VGRLFQIDEHTALAAVEETAQENDCVMELPSLTRTNSGRYFSFSHARI
jgi:hypothetical protein